MIVCHHQNIPDPILADCCLTQYETSCDSVLNNIYMYFQSLSNYILKALHKVSISKSINTNNEGTSVIIITCRKMLKRHFEIKIKDNIIY